MPSVDSINKAVCFDHFPPFFLFFWHNAGSKLLRLSLEKNRYWHYQRCHRLRVVSGGSAPTRSSCLHVVMLWPSFAFKFSYVILPPLPVQSSCMPLIPIADTGLRGWLNRKYTHLAAGHRSTTSHKVATMYSAYNIHSFSRLPELQRGKPILNYDRLKNLH